LLIVPVLARERRIGGLVLASPTPRPWDPDEIALMETVGRQLGAVAERLQLEESRQRLSAAIEQAAEAVIITDTDGTILYVNPAFEQVTGYSLAEVVGRNARILKSGEQDDAFYRELWETITAGRVWQGRFVNKKKDGSLYTEDATITPVRNQAGEIVNFVAVKHDVTWEIALEEQFRQAQKLEALGRLAGGVAHDFNNLLTVIHLSTRMLERYLRSEDPLWEHVQRIRESGERAANLTKQLLSFSRREMIEPRVVNLNELVSRLADMLRRIIGEHIKLLTLLDDELWPVYVDPAQVDQVIMNLVVNARDAMLQGGTLTIETSNVVLDEAYSARHVDTQPGEYVILIISDTGVGMSEEVKARIFEPFFTTKERGKGTGLGLSTAFGIVKQNDGHIWVYSEEGRGTTFKIYLPRTKETESGSPARTRPLTPVRPIETEKVILIVEDNADVRNLAVTALKTHGYQVLAAKNGVEALQISLGHEGPIHLLLTDVVMPDIGGAELVEQIRAQRPETNVLYMSGYANSMMVRRGIVSEDALFLPKPFDVDALIRKVREALSEDAPSDPSADS
jgi:PAS domain S-box-containing protein